MKKKLFWLITGLIFISACDKTDIKDKIDEAGQKLKNAGFYTDQDSKFEEDVIAYNLLSLSEMHSLWENHLENARDQFGANSDKGILLQSLIDNLSDSCFYPGSTAYINLTTNFQPEWEADAQGVFSAIEYYDISTEPYRDTIGVSRSISEPSGRDLYATPKCFCHTGTRGFSCTKIGFPGGIELGICSRTEATCTERPRGCGWLWLYSCDGNHCDF